ncbi:MAG: peptidylprolyl isomerase [Pseudobacteriovorax sp.]|nr:peptidylprolyl isomerase [Pseudobacteriovorax sp.]
MFNWKGKDISQLDGNRFWKDLPAYIILALAVGAMTFFGVCEPSGNRMASLSGVAASVAGSDITAIQFRRAHIQRMQQAQQQYKDGFDAVQLGISQQVVNSLVDQEVYYQEAVKNGFAASEAEVANIIIDGAYFSNEEGKFDANLFQRYLRSQAHSEASFSEELKRNIVTTKLRNFMTTTYRSSQASKKIDKILSDTKLNVSFVEIDPNKLTATVTHEEVSTFAASDEGKVKIKSFYDRNTGDYNKPETVKVRHILIGHKDATRATGEAAKRSKEDAKALADKVLKEAKANPAKFVDLVKQYTDEPSGKVKGGDLGYIKKGDMVPAFEEAAFVLKKSQISGVVETNFGYHIILSEDKKDAVNTTLETATPQIAKTILLQEKRPKLATELGEKLVAAIDDGQALKSLLAENRLDWKDSGEFALNARFLPGGLDNDQKLKEAAVGLKKVGDIHPELISASGKSYLIRLKDRKEADVSNITVSKDDPLGNLGNFEAFFSYSKLMGDVKQQYEQDNKIYRSEEFLQYDAKLKAQQSGS